MARTGKGLKQTKANRDVRLDLRISAEEAAELRAAAIADGMKRAEYARGDGGAHRQRPQEDLVERILAVRAHDDQVGARISSMEAEIDQYQAAALELTGNEAISAELGRLTAATGAEAMTGPGVTLTLDDALESGVGGGSDPRNSTGFTDGRVTARDLQIVVNGLWQAGAEAMAVNGMRLTARSSIRFAGNALLVDFRPLTRPYLITAIGDPQALEPSFAATVAGGYLSALVDNYSIRAEFADEAVGAWPPQGPLFIHHLANQVDPATRTFGFYLPLENQPRTFERDGTTHFAWRYRPGQRVRLYLPVEKLVTLAPDGKTEVLPFVLPAGAVAREGGEAYVFVQSGDTFRRKPVRVLHADRADVVVANDGSVSPIEFVVRNQAAALNRAVKAQAAGGGGDPHAGHSHD